MQDIRHLNLFSRITKVNTRFYARYNGSIIFCVPKEFLRKAVGEEGKNIKKMSEILGRRIRIIQRPRGIQDAKGFIQTIVKPVMFKDLEIKEDKIILTAGNIQNKAALIGRDKKRFFEMQKIVKDFFGKDLIIV
jgi:transcription antitermination factor NusA-like protein